MLFLMSNRVLLTNIVAIEPLSVEGHASRVLDPQILAGLSRRKRAQRRVHARTRCPSVPVVPPAQPRDDMGETIIGDPLSIPTDGRVYELCVSSRGILDLPAVIS